MRAILLASAIAFTTPATAQPIVPPSVETQISPDTGPLSLGTTTTTAGALHTIDGGTRAGANLFHSFSRFDLGSGDTARYVATAGDPAAIDHVVSRVTGGERSAIFGTIDSTALPNADFWFINPAGIVFGPGAQLNVPAAARFSTGSELRFADGPAFAVTTPGGSTLSVASPIAFGFVGGESGIAVAGADRTFLPDGGRLTLAGADVAVVDSNVAGGVFQLLGVGDLAVEIPLADPLAAPLAGRVFVDSSILRLDGAALGTGGIRIGGGAVDLSRSDLGTDFVSGPDQGISGPIAIQGGSVRLFSTLVSASTFGPESAAPILIGGGSILITGGSIVSNDARTGSTGEAGLIGIQSEEIRIEDRSRISSSTQTAQSGGGIVLEAERIVVSGSTVASDTLADATGDAGAILIAGGRLDVVEGGSISSSTTGAGNAGGILIELTGPVTLNRGFIGSRADIGSTGNAGTIGIVTPGLTLLDQSAVSTATFGAGAGGLIGISAANVLVDGFSEIESKSDGAATGDAGRIFITGERLTLGNGGMIGSDTFGIGRGGGIEIEVAEIAIASDGGISSDSLIECVAEPCARGGDAGDIRIVADRLTIRGSTEQGSAPSRAISSDTRASGAAGSIDLRLGTLDMDGNAFISSDTSGSGAGGFITVAADSIALRNNAFISTGTFGAGAGGAILIEAGSLRVEDDAGIRSQSVSVEGAPGGRISIEAGTIVIRRAEINSSGLGNGDAGQIDIGGNRLELDLGAILSDTQGAGQGGDVLIRSRDVVLRNSSLIAADSLGCFLSDCESIGDAGSVTIIGDSLTIGGAEDSEIGLQPAKISSEAFSTGDAGDILIRVERLSLDIGTISSGTQSEGDAGTIDIEAGEVALTNFSAIQTGSTPFCPDGICLPGGNAGSVMLRARGDVRLSGFSQISSNTSGSGDAGGVAVEARNLSLARSRITTASEIGATGEAGAIAIAVGALLLTDASEISSEASNALPAGAVAIRADRVRIQDPLSQVSSANNENGDAGAVLVETGALELIEGGRISTSSTAGAAGDIAIVTPDDALIRLTGRTFVSEITTSSGPGTGGRIIITNPYAIISDGGSILALGEQGGANVQIQTGFFIRSADRVNRVAVDGDFLLEAQVGDVSSGTVERDLSILDASGVLRGQCAATRATGQVSQLVVRPVGPYGRGRVGPPRVGNPCE